MFGKINGRVVGYRLVGLARHLKIDLCILRNGCKHPEFGTGDTAFWPFVLVAVNENQEFFFTHGTPLDFELLTRGVFYITFWVNTILTSMHLDFADRKFEKECNDERLLHRRHGARRARLLMRRLVVLAEANKLSDLGPPYRGPMRCHELSGSRDGQLSIDLDHPYRLIFVPNHNPIPLRSEGGLDWNAVTAIRIIEVTDTHG